MQLLKKQLPALLAKPRSFIIPFALPPLAVISAPSAPLSRFNLNSRNLATLISDPFSYSSKVVAPPPSQEPPLLPATLKLQDGTSFCGTSFGARLHTGLPVTGEVVFTTSLVGYPESMTDPSYRGQILVFTQPLIGNYGVPAPTKDAFGLLKHFESSKIQVKAIIVNDYATKYSHWNAIESLGSWCARSGIPAISGVDTRAVTTLLRDKGSMIGQLTDGLGASLNKKGLSLPCQENVNLIAQVSCKKVRVYNPKGSIRITLVDCGVKQNIIRCLAKLDAQVHVVPWDYDLNKDLANIQPHGIFLSNGPGSPLHVSTTVKSLSTFMANQAKSAFPMPIFGICMGNQLLGLAAGFKVYKLPYGNRGHNQPVINLKTGACMITSQNHGYALKDSDPDCIPKGWVPFFRNANDGSNEGIRHLTMPWSSVQFHPEAMGGPLDTEYLFEDFIRQVERVKAAKQKALGHSLPLARSPKQKDVAVLKE